MQRRAFVGALASGLALAGCSTSVPSPRTKSVPSVLPPRFAERDPVAWPGRTPVHYPVHGIDVSRFPGAVDWRRARAAGTNFAWIKATEGGDRLDPRFAQNFAGASAAGVVAGAYHFYYFCTPPEVQAAWMIANVPRASGALPPVVDLEWNPFSPTCTHRPPGAEVRAVVQRFVGILQAHYGRQPVIYTTRDFWPENGIGRYDGEVWLRAVTEHPSTAYPGASWSFWQYSSTGHVDGVTGPCDLNCFSGSAQSWRAWLAARRQPG